MFLLRITWCRLSRNCCDEKQEIAGGQGQGAAGGSGGPPTRIMNICSDKLYLVPMVTAALPHDDGFCCHRVTITFLSQIWRQMPARVLGLFSSEFYVCLYNSINLKKTRD